MDSTKNSKRILFLTGSRSDYGKMKPLMKAVEAHPDLECSIAITGMHLMPKYGMTAAGILNRDGYSDVHTFSNQDEEIPARRDQIVADTIKGLSLVIDQVRPDMLIIHGDRPEALAGAVCGSMKLLLTAHIEGGELSGTIDETIRHAVSKLCHVHFVSNNEARKRLLQLGEIESSVYVIGSPNIDIMLSKNLPAMPSVRERYTITFKEYIVLLYHPGAFELPGLEERINWILDTIKESGRCCVAIFPNNEEGSETIIHAYQTRKHKDWLRVLPSMRFEYYLTLLKNAQGIVGNSSSGIHEAPVYGIPAVNLGTRQKKRFEHQSVTTIPETPGALKEALAHLKEPGGESVLHFGKGNSCQEFLSAITGKAIWQTSTEKQFRDI